MTASSDLLYKQRTGESYGYFVAANKVLYRHAAGGITSTKTAVPAGDGSCVALLGLAEENTVAGQLVRFRKGVFNLPVTGATPAVIGAAVYASADDTFTMTQSGSLLQLGTLHAVDADGAWVKIN